MLNEAGLVGNFFQEVYQYCGKLNFALEIKKAPEGLFLYQSYTKC